jgi:hypothetical protein
MSADWSPLATELQLWASNGRKPLLWLRDDDAIKPNAALDRLLSMCSSYRVPAVLAVIPEPSGAELADHLKDSKLINVAVHGWRHTNHAASGEKKQELGSHRPIMEIVFELERGFTKLKSLHGDRFLPMLVPPWNRMNGALLGHLPAIGFQCVSSYGDALAGCGTHELAIVNTHIDIMDWSSRHGRDHATLIADLVLALRKSREAAYCPVGILAHHRDHDETAWSFLDQLFEMTAGDGVCAWLDGEKLLDGTNVKA